MSDYSKQRVWLRSTDGLLPSARRTGSRGSLAMLMGSEGTVMMMVMMVMTRWRLVRRLYVWSGKDAAALECGRISNHNIIYQAGDAAALGKCSVHGCRRFCCHGNRKRALQEDGGRRKTTNSISSSGGGSSAIAVLRRDDRVHTENLDDMDAKYSVTQRRTATRSFIPSAWPWVIKCRPLLQLLLLLLLLPLLLQQRQKQTMDFIWWTESCMPDEHTG